MTPEFIVIHHSLTADSGTVSWGTIRKYHLAQGWRDVGYHWGVELVGDHYEVLMGRPMTEVGAHAKEVNMNERSIGICVVGNFDAEVPSVGVLEATARIVNQLMHLYGILRSEVIGHRDVGLMAGLDWQAGQFKSCPGKLFRMDLLRGMLT